MMRIATTRATEGDTARRMWRRRALAELVGAARVVADVQHGAPIGYVAIVVVARVASTVWLARERDTPPACPQELLAERATRGAA